MTTCTETDSGEEHELGLKLLAHCFTEMCTTETKLILTQWKMDTQSVVLIISFISWMVEQMRKHSNQICE